jgi:hypothetical protein
VAAQADVEIWAWLKDLDPNVARPPPQQPEPVDPIDELMRIVGEQEIDLDASRRRAEVSEPPPSRRASRVAGGPYRAKHPEMPGLSTISIDAAVVDRRAIYRPSESYSDVILRLVELEAAGLRSVPSGRPPSNSTPLRANLLDRNWTDSTAFTA